MLVKSNYESKERVFLQWLYEIPKTYRDNFKEVSAPIFASPTICNVVMMNELMAMNTIHLRRQVSMRALRKRSMTWSHKIKSIFVYATNWLILLCPFLFRLHVLFISMVAFYSEGKLSMINGAVLMFGCWEEFMA